MLNSNSPWVSICSLNRSFIQDVLIPHRNKVRYLGKEHKAINANIILSTYTLIEGYLFIFIRHNYGFLTINDPSNPIITEFKKDHEEIEKKLERKIEFIDKLGVPIKQVRSYCYLPHLIKVRNKIAHGGDITIEKHWGFLKRIPLFQKIDKDNNSEKFTELFFQDEVADFYFEKGLDFIQEIQNYSLDENARVNIRDVNQFNWL